MLYIKRVKLRRANTTLAPSQVSCKSRHLFPHSHVRKGVMPPFCGTSLAAIFTDRTWKGVCFILCERVTRKLPHPHFSASQLSPDAILPNCLTKCSESGSFPFFFFSFFAPHNGLISCGMVFSILPGGCDLDHAELNNKPDRQTCMHDNFTRVRQHRRHSTCHFITLSGRGGRRNAVI